MDGPVCPNCQEHRFDDWWNEPTLKGSSGSLRGRLKCHGCGRFFSIMQIMDGSVISTVKRKNLDEGI
jgi:transcriptional regulator NrdR family protein